MSCVGSNPILSVVRNRGQWSRDCWSIRLRLQLRTPTYIFWNLWLRCMWNSSSLTWWQFPFGWIDRDHTRVIVGNIVESYSTKISKSFWRSWRKRKNATDCESVYCRFESHSLSTLAGGMADTQSLSLCDFYRAGSSPALGIGYVSAHVNYSAWKSCSCWKFLS